MTIKEFVLRYIDCNKCDRKCCNAIDDSAFIGTDERVPRDNIDRENNFFISKDETCVYFEESLCSIYGNGIRPFLCRVYPFRVADGKLFIDDWCMYGKEIVAAINKNDLELIKDLVSVRDWMSDNVPAQLAEFWEERRKKGKYKLGAELIIQ